MQINKKQAIMKQLRTTKQGFRLQQQQSFQNERTLSPPSQNLPHQRALNNKLQMLKQRRFRTLDVQSRQTQQTQNVTAKDLFRPTNQTNRKTHGQQLDPRELYRVTKSFHLENHLTQVGSSPQNQIHSKKQQMYYLPRHEQASSNPSRFNQSFYKIKQPATLSGRTSLVAKLQPNRKIALAHTAQVSPNNTSPNLEFQHNRADSWHFSDRIGTGEFGERLRAGIEEAQSHLPSVPRKAVRNINAVTASAATSTRRPQLQALNQTVTQGFQTTQEELDFAQASFRRSIAAQRKSIEEISNQAQIVTQRKPSKALDPIHHYQTPSTSQHQDKTYPDLPKSSKTRNRKDGLATAALIDQPGSQILPRTAQDVGAMRQNRQIQKDDMAMNKTYAPAGAYGAFEGPMSFGDSPEQVPSSPHAVSRDHATRKRQCYQLSPNRDGRLKTEESQQSSQVSGFKDAKLSPQGARSSVMMAAVRVQETSDYGGGVGAQSTSFVNRARLEPRAVKSGIVNHYFTHEGGMAQPPSHDSFLFRGHRNSSVESGQKYAGNASNEKRLGNESSQLQTLNRFPGHATQQTDGATTDQASCTDPHRIGGRTTPTKKVPALRLLEISSIPKAIATKSSRGCGTLTGTQLKKGGSTLDKQSGSGPPVGASSKRIQIRKLASFNDDLKDVVDDVVNNNRSVGSGSKGPTGPGSEFKVSQGVFNTMGKRNTGASGGAGALDSGPGSHARKTEEQTQSVPRSIDEQDDKQGEERLQQLEDQKKAEMALFLASKGTLKHSRQDQEALDASQGEGSSRKNYISRPPRLQIKSRKKTHQEVSSTSDQQVHQPEHARRYSHFPRRDRAGTERRPYTLVSSGATGSGADHTQSRAQPSHLAHSSQGQRLNNQQPIVPLVTAPPTALIKARMTPMMSRLSPTLLGPGATGGHDQPNSALQPVSPLIIYANNLERRQQSNKRENGNFSSRKLTLEERTLKQIKELKENNSIIIDCNALVSDQKLQRRNQKKGVSQNAQRRARLTKDCPGNKTLTVDQSIGDGQEEYGEGRHSAMTALSTQRKEQELQLPTTIRRRGKEIESGLASNNSASPSPTASPHVNQEAARKAVESLKLANNQASQDCAPNNVNPRTKHLLANPLVTSKLLLNHKNGSNILQVKPMKSFAALSRISDEGGHTPDGVGGHAQGEVRIVSNRSSVLGQNPAETGLPGDSDSKLRSPSNNRYDNLNSDIKEVKSGRKESGKNAIGVGSVVLHLRKNRQQTLGNSQCQQRFTSDEEGSGTQMAMGRHTGDVADRQSYGTRGMSSHGDARELVQSAEMTLPLSLPTDAQVGVTSARGGTTLLQGDLGASSNPGSVDSSTQRGAQAQYFQVHRGRQGSQISQKNGQVLRQKHFTNLVRKKNKLASPRQPNHKPVKKRNRLVDQKSTSPIDSAALELVGTQKEKVQQAPRAPKYDAHKQRRNLRGGSYQPPRASFIIPHYNYFGNNAMGFPMRASPDNLGETLHPQEAQMHQIITLQNGQMMIRRVDVSQLPGQQISINFEKSHPQAAFHDDGSTFLPGSQLISPTDMLNPSLQINEGPTPNQNASPVDFKYTPVTRLGLGGVESPCSNHAPGQSVTPPVGGYTPSNINNPAHRHQFLEIVSPDRATLPRNKQGSQQAVDTVCGTDKSITSLMPGDSLRENSNMRIPSAIHASVQHNQSACIDQESSQNQTSSRLVTRNVTSGISQIAQDVNKSNEVLMRGIEDTLLMTHDVVQLSQRFARNPSHQNASAQGFIDQSFLPQNVVMGRSAFGSNPNDISRVNKAHNESPSFNDHKNLKASPDQGSTPSPMLHELKAMLARPSPVLTKGLQQANDRGVQPSSSANSPRKLIILNNQRLKPTVKLQATELKDCHDPGSGAVGTIIETSKVTQQSFDSVDEVLNFPSALKVAKLQNHGQSASRDRQVEGGDLRVEDKETLQEQERINQPFVLPFSAAHDHQRGYRVHQDVEAQEDLQPWGDQPDVAMSQEKCKLPSPPPVRKQVQSKVKMSWEKSLSKGSASLRQSFASHKKMAKARDSAAAMAAGQGSNQSFQSLTNSGKQPSGRKNTQTKALIHVQSSSTAGKQSVASKKGKNVSPHITLTGRAKTMAIVVQDKAKVSKREKQERAMQDIVFDDSAAVPQFRKRGEDDKTLEEIAKKPMTVNFADSEDAGLHAGDSNVNERARRQQAEDQSPGQRRTQLRKAKRSGSSSPQRGKKDSKPSSPTRRANNSSLTNQAHIAVMLEHREEMQALQTADLYYGESEAYGPKKKRIRVPDHEATLTASLRKELLEITRREELELMVNQGEKQYADNEEVNSQDEAYYEKRPAGWSNKRGLPKNLDTSYLNQARLDSYFQQ